MMIGSGKITYSSDQGKTWSTVEKLSAPLDYVIALQSGAIGGPVPEKPASSAAVILAVWNQVSSDEIRAGYRRGRLSSAISKDDGKTWQHFRTVDTAVLPPAGRVEPDPEPQMARGLDYVGVLPLDYGGVDYATLRVPNGDRHREFEIEARFHEDRSAGSTRTSSGPLTRSSRCWAGLPSMTALPEGSSQPPHDRHGNTAAAIER